MRILYLDLDTLRPDHLGCYGYHRDTSPNIDSMAREGVRFDNYYCSDAPCLPSRAALVTGRFGFHTGVINHGGTNADLRIEGPSRGFRDRCNFDNLYAYIRWELGLHTVSVSPFAERHSAWWFNAGFMETHNPGQGGNESAEEVTPIVLDWIDRNGFKDNWFLHVNYWDPHTPYRAPASFGNPFKNDPLPKWLTKQTLEKHRNMVGPHGAREISMYDNKTNPKYPRHLGEIKNMRDLHDMIDGYDCGIRYMDSHIGMIVEALRRKGVYDDLMIIVSSDHGENLGELGIYGEHGTADHITCRIPMIVRGPKVRKGHVDSGLHYNLDLAPTLAQFFNKAPRATWDGRSYARTLSTGANCGRDYLVLSQCAHVCQRSVRFADWLYMRTYHDGYHLFPDEMLFNIAGDPHEQRDVARRNPAVVRDAVRRLYEWRDQMMAASGADTDPLWTVMKEGGPFHAKGHLASYCTFLEKTGRAWAVPELKKRHPREF